MSGSSRILERVEREIRAEVGALSLSGATAGLAFRAALAGVLAVVAAMAINLDSPYWAGITAFGLLQHDVVATISRSLDRVLGTIVGAAIGFVLAATAADHLVFSVGCAAVVSVTLYAQARVEHSYAVLLVGITALLVVFGSLSEPDAALRLAVNRGLEIIVGAVIASLIDMLLAPDRGHPLPGAAKPGVFARPVDVELLVIAITAGLAIGSVPTVWNGLELPGLGQTPITALVIMIAMRGDPHWTAATRILGCLAGGAYGLIGVALIDDSFVLFVGSLFLGLYLSGHVLHRQGQASYAGYQAGIAIILAMVEGAAPSTSFLPAIDRMVGIVGGIVLVVVFQVLFSPLVRRCVLLVVRPAAAPT